MKRAIFIGLIGFASFLSACGEGNSFNPSQVDLTGVWKGTAVSAVNNGSQNVTFTLVQEGPDPAVPDSASSITGQYVCEPGTISCLHPTGIISGASANQTFGGGIIFPNGHSCGFNGTPSETVLNGEYTCSRAAGGDFGTLSLIRPR